jgi:hypothetical protein
VSTNKKFGEYAVAATAFFVSVCSLFIYVYQSKLMAEQQQVAVWPYVQWSTSNAESFDLQAENKGVGPALVRKVAMTFNGKAVAGNHALVAAVVGTESDLKWQNSTLEGNVLSVGEKVTLFRIADKATGRAFEDKLDAGKFTLEITYCSIYGRCWTSTGFTAKRAPDDKSIDY